jgi:signal transduction histidine kinase/DNA-binding response OmpR family regulator
MLAQIQQSEQALRTAHDQLEERVQERTAELVAAKKEVEAFSLSVVRAKEEIERASKFKDQFLSTMSHELRTPLNAVLGFSDLLTEERYGPLNDRQRRYVNHIHTGGRHLLSLINDILDLSKIEAGRLQLTIETVRVSTSFAEVVDTMRPLADKKSQSLVMEAPRELNVRADATRFKQVLMNLIGNAIKFTPEGGKIELGCRPLGQVVRVEVRDSGPGIPLEEQKRIFEAFHRLQQSEKSVEGTGLGLAITRRLVELHGGHLDLESQPGLGSCFYFTLPSAVAPGTEELKTSGSGPKTGEGVRILVVEDDSAAAQLLQSHLAAAGYDVVLCQQPQRAVEMAAQLQPSAVTMDIIMKPVNGWELLSKLKSDPHTCGIPVIVVTVVDQPATGVLLGADEYIVKPVEKATLLAAVERCMNRRGRIGRARPILVVEDDTPTREFIAELLSKHGYAVDTAADGTEARARVATSSPELVILDLILPGVSGFQLLAEWRFDSRTSDLPVFVLTSKDLTAEEKDYIHANTGALFQKQDQWQEALIRQLQRAAPPLLVEKS